MMRVTHQPDRTLAPPNSSVQLEPRQPTAMESPIPESSLMRRHHPPEPHNLVFGMELVMDLDGCNLAVLTDADRIRRFAAKLVDLINMRAYGPALVEHFGHDNPVTAGYTLVQLIETSSIVAHFSDQLQRAHVNVFSCLVFDFESAIDFTESFLAARDTTYTVIHR